MKKNKDEMLCGLFVNGVYLTLIIMAVYLYAQA